MVEFPCEQCGEVEGTRTVMDFDTKEKEVLCFPCRYPILKKRLGWDERDEDSENERIESEDSGQMSIGDF